MAELNNILEVATIIIGVFLLERYVFIEIDMEAKKQHIFYFISVILIFISYIIFGKDIASIMIFLLGGFNISLGRKKHRFRGFFLIIPLPGIIKGLILPFLIIPPNLLGFSKHEIDIYNFIIYCLLSALLLAFYIKAKEWRKWFKSNMQKRYLQRWESFLLCIIGLLMMTLQSVISWQFKYYKEAEIIKNDYTVGGEIAWSIVIYGITAFVLTITIIILVMQGNKRAYYYEQSSNMQFNMIAVMADIVESRDENTGGHIKRTAKYVEIISKTLKKQNAFPDILTEQYISNMIIAAPLHDIGKVHISDVVLNKPGKLTSEEFEIMKTHAIIGREFLKQAKKQIGESEYLNIAIDMAGYHHKWWNGQGYPEKAKGEDIPLCARIMAIADVFDALSSKRCYREAMPLEKVYNIIREESGTHFDTVIVDAFFESIKEVEKALKNF